MLQSRQSVMIHQYRQFRTYDQQKRNLNKKKIIKNPQVYPATPFFVVVEKWPSFQLIAHRSALVNYHS